MSIGLTSELPGQLITFEGSEGAGKTTQVSVAEAWLKAQGLPCFVTREPGGPALSEKLRQLLLDDAHAVVADAELLMLFAARAQQIQQWIIPKLAQGYFVLCDRFTDSSYAYQGAGRGFDIERIQYLEDWIQGTLQPDMTLYYDIEVTLGLSRASRRSEKDRIEQESMDFFERVRQEYVQRVAAFPERMQLIDASGSLVEVTRATEGALQRFLSKVQACD